MLNLSINKPKDFILWDKDSLYYKEIQRIKPLLMNSRKYLKLKKELEQFEIDFLKKHSLLLLELEYGEQLQWTKPWVIS